MSLAKHNLYGVYIAYVLLIIIAVNTAIPLLSGYFKTGPYNQVEEIVVDWEEEVLIRYSFFKNGACHLKTFAVVGYSDGVPRYLEYKDLDALPDHFDREEGEHSLNILVDTKGVYYDKIELRTRHICGKEIVNKVFATIKNPRG